MEVLRAKSQLPQPGRNHQASLSQDSSIVGVGREYYLWGSADQPCNKWRVGADLGGRIGSAKVDFNEIEHRTDNLWGAYVAVHSDWEMPCGSFVWFAGLRVEYGYTWTSILQSQNNSDVGDLAVLINLGVRF